MIPGQKNDYARWNWESYVMTARELPAKGMEYEGACFESVSGNVDEALALLKTALEKRQLNLEWARRDPDLVFIRDDSRFKALVGLSPDE